MDLKLEDKVALISGARRDLGAVSAKALAARGATVVINYKQSMGKARDLLAEIMNAGGRGMTFQATVRKADEVDAMATSGQPKAVNDQIADMTPLRRLGMPNDIAGAVLFLASSLSDYLNGEYLPVIGGSFLI